MATTANSPSVNGARSSPTLSDVQHLWSRYEAATHADQTKNTLIEDVIHRYDELLRTHHRYIEEHAQGSASSDVQYWQGQALRLQGILNQNPFIVTLIDGDSLLFHPSFISQGAIGGQHAATLLRSAILDRIVPTVPDCPHEVKVVARIYANLAALRELCARTGLTTSPDQLNDFFRGLTQAAPLFDVIDVGSLKDAAPAKVVEAFKLFIADFHCRQVVLGCDGGKAHLYASDQCLADEYISHRLTFIGASSEAKGVEGQTTVAFPGIFSQSKHVDRTEGGRGRVDSRVGLNGASGVFTPTRTETPVSTHSPLQNNTNLDMRQKNGHAPLPNGVNKPTTWAAITTINAHKPLTTAPPPRAPLSPPPKQQDILRNKKGQRLDRHMEYDRNDVLRIKKLKSCNQHYIGVGCCHYNAGKEDKCPHAHHHKFSAQDLKALRVVARETPCKSGHECDNPKCIYGHQCPFPAPTEGSMRGIGCMNGDTCRFPRSMHDMDTVPAKMTRVTGAF